MTTNEFLRNRQGNLLWQLLTATGLFTNQVDLVQLSNLPEFSAEEIRHHATPADCWIIINHFVYDITDFLNKHPGGSEILWEHLGHDATIAFIGSGHSDAAHKMMAKFLIGRLRPV